MYQILLAVYFEAHEITDLARRYALLVALLSGSAGKILQERCHPKYVNELEYRKIVQYLQSHYTPKLNEISPRYRFSYAGPKGRRSFARVRSEIVSLGRELQRRHHVGVNDSRPNYYVWRLRRERMASPTHRLHTVIKGYRRVCPVSYTCCY